MGKLNDLDFLIIGAYFVVSFIIGVIYTKRAGKGLSEFFASGHSLPWWLLGISMVATTFSTDTPNLVTDIVRQDGVAGNWAWWAFLLSGMMTVFFFSKMWRRLNVLTDLEFYELRYSGKSASFLRGFRAIYLGVVLNVFIMATVTLAAVKIGSALFDWKPLTSILLCIVVTAIYSAMSGLWGVIVTDLFQFVFAMVGSVALACYAVDKAGGMSQLLTTVETIKPGVLNLIPDGSNLSMLWTVLLIPLLVQWWSAWYPGAEPGGGSYIAQRMIAAKDEKNAFGAVLLFNVAHYALRPWPWIIVALASLTVYPTLDSIRATGLPDNLVGHDIAYPLMVRFLPNGLLGVMVASLAAAYMSTISTHLNWGSSYLVNDLYKRSIVPNKSESHYIWVARFCTLVLMALAGCMTFFIDNAKQAFNIIVGFGAGTGLVYLLRWYWWRVNPWSEISAMVAAGVATIVFMFGNLKVTGEIQIVATVVFTTVVWVTTTFLTSPTSKEQLIAFYRKIRPAGPGWRHIAALCPDVKPEGSLKRSFFGWVFAIAAVYTALFATGNLLYGNMPAFGANLVACVLSVAILIVLIRSDQPSTDK